MICSNCGKEFNNDYDFCPYCGKKAPSIKVCPDCGFESFEYNFCLDVVSL